MHRSAGCILTLFALALAACADVTAPERSPVLETGQAGPSNTDYVLPPIKVVAPGGCDPYTDLNWCQGDDDCMMGSATDDSQTISGCLPPIPPGGGTSPPTCPSWDPACTPPCPIGDPTCASPPPTEPGDTCRTNDPVVDDPDVSQGLASLWIQSNPDANLYQRTEKAGWIVEYPAGQYSIMQFTGTERFGCGEYRNVPFPSQGRIVGIVHTHPYEVGEFIADCNLRNVQTYDGTPSEVDRKTAEELGRLLGLGGPLPGYIIDKDGYYRYDGWSNTATPRRPRCGY